MKLIDICTPKQWKTIATKNLKENGYLVYGANGVIGHYDKYNHENSTLLITCRGATCGEINISEPKSYINGNAMCLDNLSKGCNIKYLYYYLKNYDFKRGIISGTAQPQITIEGLNKVQIYIPSLSEQERIAKELDVVCGAMEKQKKQLELCDTLIKSKFNEMFGEHYELKLLKECCKKITDGSHNPPKSIEFSKFKMLSSQNIINNEISYNNCRYLSEQDFYNENKRTNLQKGDLLMTIVGTIGRFAIYQCDDPIVLQRSVAVIKAKDIINVKYLMYCLLSDNLQYEILKNTRGVAQQGIYLNDLSNLKIPVPPLPLQQKFADFVNKVEQNKVKIKQSLNETETLYKALMQKYFDKGEV